jgi:hypothetical protein
VILLKKQHNKSTTLGPIFLIFFYNNPISFVINLLHFLSSTCCIFVINLSHTGIFSTFVENEREEAKRLSEVAEVATLLERLTLLSSQSEEDDTMDAHEFINFELEFDLNNPYQPTDEDIIDCLSSEDQDCDLDEDIVDVDEVVGLNDAECCLETLKKFLQQRPENVLSDVKNIQDLHKKVCNWRVKESRQTRIDSYFEST